MINIYLCEDDEKQRKKLTDFIKDYIMMEDYDMKVVLSTGCPFEVLKQAQKESGAIYLLDIDLKSDINGVDLAKKIREFDRKGCIIFITTHIELMYLTFEYAVEALGYIQKKENFEVMKTQIIDHLKIAKERLGNTAGKEKMFTLKTGSKIIMESFKDILFFEISEKGHKKITMYTKNRVVEFNGTLAEIESQDDSLFRCDRSCVINIRNIESFNRSTREIRFINGDTCLGSIRGLSQLEKRLSNY